MKPCNKLFIALLLVSAPFAQAVHASGVTGATEQLLEQYRAAGAGPFSAEAGAQMWSQKFGTDSRSCTSCHTADLRSSGKHQRTGKAIQPLAPSANPRRLSETKKIEKWFKRNCKWTLDRTCTPQEKGDFLLFINAQ